MQENFKMMMRWPCGRKRRLIEYMEDEAAYLKEIAPLDPLLSTWFLQGNSVAEAQRYDLFKDFQRCYEKEARLKRNKEADRGGPSGFLLGVWNGHTEVDQGMSTFSVRGWGDTDSFSLRLPWRTEVSENLFRIPTLVAIIHTAAKRWPLRWVHVSSDEYQRDKLLLRGFRGVGWMAYVPAILAASDFPEAAQIIHLGTLGSVVVTTNEVFSSENPDHVERANNIAVKLFDRGLLERAS
jgi:hypothetical protein